jgi:hypothetical protein
VLGAQPDVNGGDIGVGALGIALDATSWGVQKMRCDIGSSGPRRSGKSVYQAFANSTRGGVPSVKRARNRNSEIFVVLQEYARITVKEYLFSSTTSNPADES